MAIGEEERRKTAQRKYDAEVNLGNGTWAAFARRLNLCPQRGVCYLWHLLQEREAWIEQELGVAAVWGDAGWSVRLDDGSRGADMIRDVDPSAWLVEDVDDAEDEDDVEDVDFDSDALVADDDADDEDDDAGEPPSSAVAGQEQREFRGRAWYPKLFSLVPVAKTRRRFVRIDEKVCKKALGCSIDEWITRPPPRSRKGELLGDSVVTDGYYIGVVYKVPGYAPSRKTRPPPPPVAAPVLLGTRVVGIDPGTRNIAYFYETLAPCEGGSEESAERSRSGGLGREQWRNATGAEGRLSQTTAWCADLRAAGGAFSLLATVTAKTASLDRFVAYARVSQSVRAAVLEERMKARWAHSTFKAWSRGTRCLARWWSAVFAGRLDDGTFGARVIVGYGDATFPASGKGRKSAPTTAMRKAAVTAAAAFQGALHATPLVSEYGSTKYCSRCRCTLAAVMAAPSAAQVRSYERKVARSQQPCATMPWGLTRAPPPPPRPLPSWVRVNGMQYCDSCAVLVGRDKDAGRAIEAATGALVLGDLPPVQMRRGWDGGAKPAPLRLYHDR